MNPTGSKIFKKKLCDRYFYSFLFFYSNAVLQISGGIDEIGDMRWELCAYLALAWIGVYLVVCKGIHNSTKVMTQLPQLTIQIT